MPHLLRKSVKMPHREYYNFYSKECWNAQETSDPTTILGPVWKDEGFTKI